jgi:NADP-dependent alcohol dehydrogenase
MRNFSYYNPVRIEFGRGTIAKTGELIGNRGRVMLLYGGGSIKRNGVYDQVTESLSGHDVVEFDGIEPNPLYETCMEAAARARANDVDFLLAVGGGSVVDATKFIAAAVRFTSGDPWGILDGDARVESAVDLGCVLTLPASGSEMNSVAVISRDETGQKLPFGSPEVFPEFSILDPETTYSLPPRQLRNGIVDTYVHVVEQYATIDVHAPLQDRQAEAILLTLVERAPAILADPPDYDGRADLMWCAASALNRTIACGVITDWATHMIGHELTVLHGLDHGQTLALALPAVWRHQIERKAPRLAHYGRRVWGLGGSATGELEIAREAIDATESFFRSIGIGTRLDDYGLTLDECSAVAERLDARGAKLGEHGDITGEQVREILAIAAS